LARTLFQSPRLVVGTSNVAKRIVTRMKSKRGAGSHPGA